MVAVVPLKPVPSQEIAILLDDQSCQLKIYQRLTGLYCNLYVDNALIIGGVICQNLNRIVRSIYLGFDGDLMFVDTQGASDPTSDGLGSRFILAYLSASELPAGVG